MTLDQDVRTIADAVAAELDAKLEAKLDAVRQDLRNAVAGITGEAAVQVASASIRGVVGPALVEALAPAIAALQSKVDPQAVADVLLAPNETEESRTLYGLPLTFGNRLQNYFAYVLYATLTNDALLRDVVAALDRATTPEG